MNITNINITICDVFEKVNVLFWGKCKLRRMKKRNWSGWHRIMMHPPELKFSLLFSQELSTHFCSIFQYFQKKILFFLCEQFWDKIEFMLYILLSKKQRSCNNLYFSDLLASDLCFWKVFYNFPVWYETSTFYF